jgi:hypothetical protein
MLDIAVAARIVRDLTEQQFAAAPPRSTRIPAPAAAVAEPRAPVRRTTVRALRRLADRLEPAPRCAPQS